MMGRPPVRGPPVFRFLPAEVATMDKILNENKGANPAKEVSRALADTFSEAPERAGKVVVHQKQVWSWFQNRRHGLRKSAKCLEKPVTNTTTDIKRPVTSSTAVSSGKEDERTKMEFEAKSSRDGGWYDVHSFRAHRMAGSDDPEVRVRFAGFGPEDDEWLNVRSSVRQRSLPCESTECVALLPGDLVLCFKEGSEGSLYYDTYIRKVVRRRHDLRGCRCRFLVQYVHDSSLDIVPLRKLCRRPETEHRMQIKLIKNGDETQPLVNRDLTVVKSKENGWPCNGHISVNGPRHNAKPKGNG